MSKMNVSLVLEKSYSLVISGYMPDICGLMLLFRFKLVQGMCILYEVNNKNEITIQHEI